MVRPSTIYKETEVDYLDQNINLKINMDYKIRELKQNEISVLNTFLYEAIFIPDGVDAPSYEIINQPEIQVYVTDFGKKKGDICYISECDNKIVADMIDNKAIPIFVYCLSGKRSRQAAAVLQQMGYTNVKNIGGIYAYAGKVER